MIWHIFWRKDQDEKLSEIKPPLKIWWKMDYLTNVVTIAGKNWVEFQHLLDCTGGVIPQQKRLKSLLQTSLTTSWAIWTAIWTGLKMVERKVGWGQNYWSFCNVTFLPTNSRNEGNKYGYNGIKFCIKFESIRYNSILK